MQRYGRAEKMKRSIYIIGGGASGLSAAIAAARAGAAVTILERQARVGKKILLSGNGRCNLGHTGHEFSHYHGTLPQLSRILQHFDTEAFFLQLGLYVRADSEGRMYPFSNMAASVLDALRMEVQKLKITVRTDMMVTDLLPQKNGSWKILTQENHSLTADAVIVAAGGSAAPSCGTDGNLLPVLERLGHRIVKPRPALCPIPSDAARLRALKGMRVRAAVSLLADGTVCAAETGEVQFTENALSGICVFNLSRFSASSKKQMALSLDVLPEAWRSAEDGGMAELERLVQIRGEMPCGELLSGLLPKRVSEVCVKEAVGTVSAKTADIFSHNKNRMLLFNLLHDWRFPVTGTAKFAQAQVTAGGVSGQSITQTLSSNVQQNLYFCGEVLDADGDCGGYNLDWAWASGAWAGRHAASPAVQKTERPRRS